MTREELEAIATRHDGQCPKRSGMHDAWRAAHDDRAALLAEVRRLREVIRNADEELDGVYSDASGAVDCAQRTLRDGLR